MKLTVQQNELVRPTNLSSSLFFKCSGNVVLVAQSIAQYASKLCELSAANPAPAKVPGLVDGDEVPTHRRVAADSVPGLFRVGVWQNSIFTGTCTREA
jgi:hypothetical protein